MSETEPGAPAPLHPDTEAYLGSMARMMESRKLPPLWTIDIPRRRALNRMLVASSNPPQADCDLVQNLDIPTRSAILKGRVYRGAAVGSDSVPTIVYFHGGGFAMGGLAESEHECRRYAASVPALVVAFEYGKTPEHVYPVADEQGYDVLVWAAENASAFGGDPDRIVLAGTSCGGCLATGTSRRAVERGGPPVALVAAVTPWYDKTMSLPSMRTYANGYHLDWDEVAHYRDLYLPGGAADADPYNSPAVFPALAGMAPHYILAAECDGVVDEARAVADNLRDVGTRCDLVVATGLIHAFSLLSHLIPAAGPYLDGLHEAVRRA